MSASEKLKALDVKPELISLSAHPDLSALDVVDAKTFARLFNALPQIVAVVEAAEAVPELGEDNYLLMDMRAALAALDEALS